MLFYCNHINALLKGLAVCEQYTLCELANRQPKDMLFVNDLPHLLYITRREYIRTSYTEDLILISGPNHVTLHSSESSCVKLKNA